jgi:hypothetical protein
MLANTPQTYPICSQRRSALNAFLLLRLFLLIHTPHRLTLHKIAVMQQSVKCTAAKDETMGIAAIKCTVHFGTLALAGYPHVHYTLYRGKCTVHFGGECTLHFIEAISMG